MTDHSRSRSECPRGCWKSHEKRCHRSVDESITGDGAYDVSRDRVCREDLGSFGRNPLDTAYDTSWGLITICYVSENGHILIDGAVTLQEQLYGHKMRSKAGNVRQNEELT